MVWGKMESLIICNIRYQCQVIQVVKDNLVLILVKANVQTNLNAQFFAYVTFYERLNYISFQKMDFVRFGSIQHDIWNDSYNPMFKPSFVDGNNWKLNLMANGEIFIGRPIANGDCASMGTP